MFGEDQARSQRGSSRWARQLKNQLAVKVIRQLKELQRGLPTGPASEAVGKELNCFHEHRERMDYRGGHRAHEPIGSGAVEATCRQRQCRSQRPGQFWSQRVDEALPCLEMFWRNNRWHLLFTDTFISDPARA